MTLTLGIDLGTTKVAAVIVDAVDKKVLASASANTLADLPSSPSRSEQSVDKIFTALESVMMELDPDLKQKVSSIGVTGQMHGVVLWNKKRVSELYTWKDKRGEEEGFLAEINKIPGAEKLKNGFGSTTLAFLAKNTDIGEWEHAATIHDFLVVKLCDRESPVMDASDAASWGLFDIFKKQWREETIANLDIPFRLFPKIVEAGHKVGKLSQEFADKFALHHGIPITAAIGDNQASILSTMRNWSEELYLTLGTGAQLSAIVSPDEAKTIQWPDSVDLRPFTSGNFLAVAAPLCGGQAFAWLIDNVEKWFSELGIDAPDKNDLYRKIDELALKNYPGTLMVKPNFLGERHDPDSLGEVAEINLENFSLGNLASSLSRGIVANMHGMMPEELFKDKKTIIGSGNAVRRLSAIQEAIRQVFSMPLELVEGVEEAATGAALLANDIV